jgi:hypothetical protein
MKRYPHLNCAIEVKRAAFNLSAALYSAQRTKARLIPLAVVLQIQSVPVLGFPRDK